MRRAILPPSCRPRPVDAQEPPPLSASQISLAIYESLVLSLALTLTLSQGEREQSSGANHGMGA